MIALSNITKQYAPDITAVDRLSFEVKEGEIFGLIGTSGCGKTTTLKMINRLVEPTTGTITIAGDLVQQRPVEELRRHIGYVIQDVGLFPHYTVRENIGITPRLLGWDRNRIRQRCDELMELVGLPPATFANRAPADLSGGQQQRVGLARALSADPPVILMDEPFGALDPITKEHIQQEFKTLLREIKKTIVLVTHDVFEAFNLCDSIGLMDEGRMLQIGSPKELLFQPANTFVHSFFNNHRFQLEMMSITMEDILNEFDGLKRRPGERQRDDIPIKFNDTFFSVFENAYSNQRYFLLNEDDARIATVTSDELFKGFQHLRRKLREEPDE